MQRLSHEPKLRLSGVGRFELADCHVVYLSVQGEALRKVWWKPDFPINQFGFNPHITVFKGDKESADRVFDALTQFSVECPIELFELRVDVIGQGALNFEN
jgi:2'-5' RNA ligase